MPDNQTNLSVAAPSLSQTSDFLSQVLNQEDMRESIIEQLSGMQRGTRMVPRVVIRDGKKTTVMQKEQGYFPITGKVTPHLPLDKAIELADYCFHFFDAVYSTTYLDDTPMNRNQNIKSAAFDGMMIGQKLIEMGYDGADTFAAEFSVWMATRIKAVLDRSLGGKFLHESTSTTTNVTQTVRHEGSEPQQYKPKNNVDKIVGWLK
jgi:hypothetical protein